MMKEGGITTNKKRMRSKTIELAIRGLSGDDDLIGKMFMGKAYLCVPEKVNEVIIIKDGKTYEFTLSPTPLAR